MTRRIKIAITALAMALFGCQRDSGSDQAPEWVTADSGTIWVMGTIGRIQLRCRDEQTGRTALDSASQALNDFDRLLSTYRDDSEITGVNRRAAKEPVPVSGKTGFLLDRALYYSRLTDGAMDITVAPLIRLWKQAQQNSRVPDESEIQAALKQVGYDKISLTKTPQGPAVRFQAQGMELNVNAIAKGYAVDCALQAVRQEGIFSALVDIGGEIACFGLEQPDKKWVIGIQDPFAEDTDDPMSARVKWKLTLRDCAVATSGNYRQFFQIADKRYCHLLDPRTGCPVEAVPSVTVIAPTTLDADALATALSVLDAQKGIKLIESIPHTEAMIVTGDRENPSCHRSSGWKDYDASAKTPN